MTAVEYSLVIDIFFYNVVQSIKATMIESKY